MAVFRASNILANYNFPLIEALGNLKVFRVVKWMNNSIAVAWCYLILGGGCLVLGVFQTISTHDFLENSLVSQGQVINFDIKDGSYYPIVEYQDLSGDTSTFRSRFGCSPACYNEKERVEVLVDSTGLSEPKVNDFFSIWLMHILLFTIGSGFLIFSISQLRKLNTGT